MSFPYSKVRIAAVADLHCSGNSQGFFQPILARITERADVLLLGGDLTNYGLPKEAEILAKGITASVKIPVLAVMGNHDFESGKAEEIAHILESAGVKILDGDAEEIHG